MNGLEGPRAAFRNVILSDYKYELEARTLRVVIYAAYSPIQPLFQRKVELMPVMVEQILSCEPPTVKFQRI